MDFIQELKNAVESYETDKCITEIVNLTTSGNVLNVGEFFSFQIKVTNQSHLDMYDVKVQALGSKYASIINGFFHTNMKTSETFKLNAHQSYTTKQFRGYAKLASNGKKDIVSAGIYVWDASFDHILRRTHSGAGQPEGKLNEEIHIN